jgi:hypothetical protein
MSEKMYTESETRELVEAAIADRAKWFALFAKYVPSVIFDDAAKKAVWEFGARKRALVKDTPGSTEGMIDFLGSGFGPIPFEAHVESKTPKESVFIMENCPLIRGWKELRCTDEQIAHYCDLICSGDFGLAFECDLKCRFDTLLAHKEPCCRMVLTAGGE